MRTTRTREKKEVGFFLWMIGRRIKACRTRPSNSIVGSFHIPPTGHLYIDLVLLLSSHQDVGQEARVRASLAKCQWFCRCSRSGRRRPGMGARSGVVWAGLQDPARNEMKFAGCVRLMGRALSASRTRGEKVTYITLQYCASRA